MYALLRRRSPRRLRSSEAEPARRSGSQARCCRPAAYRTGSRWSASFRVRGRAWFSYDSAVDLQPAVAARSPRSRGLDSPCDGDAQRDNVGASLDQFEIRHASASLWPPEMSFTLAARTTEHAGLNIASVGVKCDRTLATLGPWRGYIPTPIVAIPVYAEIPITADASIGGSLSAFTLNVASTHVVSVSLGHQNNFSFQEPGSNTRTSGLLALSGHADISLGLALEFGVGDPKAGNLHVDVGFTADASWDSDQGCDVDVDLGSLSAGVKIGPLPATTPSWTPFTPHLWHGCTGSSAPTTPASGSGPTPTGGVQGAPISNPAPVGGGSSPVAAGVPSGSRPETVGGVTHTWTDPSDAGGTQGSSIQTGQTVGVAGKLQGFRVADGDSWWYRIASSPWTARATRRRTRSTTTARPAAAS